MVAELVTVTLQARCSRTTAVRRMYPRHCSQIALSEVSPRCSARGWMAMPRCSDPAIRQRLTGPDAEKDPVSTFDASILSPLHKLPRPDEGIRYILIDALDEALARSRGTTIVDLLTTTRVRLLPDWLRIVATARHEPEVLGRLRGLQALRVSVDDSANQQDVRQVTGVPPQHSRPRRFGKVVRKVAHRVA